MQGQTASMDPPPATGPTYYPPTGHHMMMRRNWRPISGAVKMVALLLDGIGIIISGASLGFLVNSLNSSIANSTTAFTSFLNTLEAGIIIAGVGAILLGIGMLLESL